MPKHVRQQIIEAAVLALTGLESTGARVYESREREIPVADLPALLVYGRPEQSAPMTMGGPNRKMERQLTLAVEGLTATTADSDAGVNQLALEVERALCNDPTLGGVCRDLFLSSTDPNARAESELRTGRIQMNFTVTYHTRASNPAESV